MNFLARLFGFSTRQSKPDTAATRIQSTRLVEPTSSELLAEFGITMKVGRAVAPADVAPDQLPSGRGDFYVYFHRDCQGQVFYVGKGTGKRAWSKERDAQWKRYLNERSGGNYTIQIVSYHSTSDEAEGVESTYIMKYGHHLTNWTNPGRQFDYAACDRYRKAKNANRDLMTEAKALEKSNPRMAIDRYQRAMRAMYDYETIVTETGLIAELMAGQLSTRGDANILDRLTLCLFRLKRYEDLDAVIADYESHFPGGFNSALAKVILNRQQRAKKLRVGPPKFAPTSNH